MPPPVEFAIRPLRPDDGRTSLSLGSAEAAPLKSFLKRHACAYEESCVARTHVLVASDDAERAGRIWGYVTLVASEVSCNSQNTPAGIHWNAKHSLPAIKLARMAIDVEIQRQGWGRKMLDWVIALVNGHVSNHVGCRLLITDAKQSAVKFYERNGFTMLDTEDNREREAPVMFIVLKKLGPQ